MRLIYHPGAERDIEKAGLFYAEQSSEAGGHFAEEFAATIARIPSAPNLGSRFKKDIRSRTMGRFPFSIYYRATGDEVIILAVKHHRRDDGYWQSRLGG